MKVVSMLLALWLTGAETQTLQVRDPNQIEAVETRGNRRLQSAQIKFKLLTKAGDILNPDIIARDIRALNDMNVFDDIRVEVEDGPKGGKVVIFYLEEKPRIQAVNYEGLKSITQSDILEQYREKKISGLSSQSTYDRAVVRRAEGVIKGMLAEKGHHEAKVEVLTEKIPPNSVILTFNVDEGPKIRVEKIEIEGNTVFSDRQIKKQMKLVKESGPLTVFTGKDTYHAGKLDYDLNQVRILYDDNGYIRANVLEPTVEIKPTTVHRTLPFIKPPFPWGIPLPFWKKTVNRYYIGVQVEENAQYKIGSIRITGNNNIPEVLIRAYLGLAEGQVYNGSALRKGFENLRKYVYGAFGYINFVPQPQYDFDENKRLVNLTIDIDEDKQYFVNRIAFSGNTTTRDKVMRRELLVYEGEIFNSVNWETSLLRLNQLGFFEEIKEEDAEVKPIPNTNQVDITVKVKEKTRNSIGFNGGVSGIGGSFLGLSYETNNFLGFGETLAVNIQGGTRQSDFILSFTEPYFRDRPLSLGVSLYSRNFRYDEAREVFAIDPETLQPGDFENRLNFEQSRIGFNLYGSYPLRLFPDKSRRAAQRLGLSFQFENSDTNAVNDATRLYFLAINSQEGQSFSPDVGSDFETFRSRKITPTFTWSTVNNPQFPSQGQSFTTSFEWTGGFLGGNVNFYRPTFEYRFFKPSTRRRNVIAFRFMTSHVSGFSGVSAPFYERFYMGGDFDIRGFDFRSVSPISWLTDPLDERDPLTGEVTQRPFDKFVYVGGDTQAVANLEYRIPLVGPITMAPFLDIGNSWVTKKDQLQRQVSLSDGTIQLQGPQFLPGTNSGVRASTGLEFQVVMPVINAPFRLIFVHNPIRLDREFFSPSTGMPFAIREPKWDFKFTVGRTF